MKKAIAITLAAILAACASTSGPAPGPAPWHSVERTDPFTDVRSCRVERGDETRRAIERRIHHAFRTLYFFVEKRDGAVRVGFMSEPAIPISGDIQVRVDDGPIVTLKAFETPLDLAPALPAPATPGLGPEQQQAILDMQRTMLAQASPYILIEGRPAEDLLRQILSGASVKVRVVTINAAAAETGIIDPAGLAEAVKACGIAIP